MATSSQPTEVKQPIKQPVWMDLLDILPALLQTILQIVRSRRS